VPHAPGAAWLEMGSGGAVCKIDCMETDVVVAGTWHNSLVAAAYLAKAGFAVVVREAADRIGGDPASKELTVPGFVHDTCSTARAAIEPHHRPRYEHRTPIRGLYETGATAHPGGSVSTGPGRNAAMVLLSDLGSSLETVNAEEHPSTFVYH